MKNELQYSPSKFEYRKGVLVASRNRYEVGVGSRLIADLVAQFYEKTLSLHAKGKLLDLGCGKVPLFLVYRNQVTSSVCVDWAGTTHKSAHLDFEHDLTEVLPFGDGEFDTVILSDVLEHIPVPSNLINEIGRVLAPEGKLILNVPFLYMIHEQPHDYYRYTEFALKRLIADANLRLVSLVVIGGAIESVADILAKNLCKIPKCGRFIASFVQWMASSIAKYQRRNRKKEIKNSSFPLGYGLVAQKPV